MSYATAPPFTLILPRLLIKETCGFLLAKSKEAGSSSQWYPRRTPQWQTWSWWIRLLSNSTLCFILSPGIPEKTCPSIAHGVCWLLNLLISSLVRLTSSPLPQCFLVSSSKRCNCSQRLVSESAPRGTHTKSHSSFFKVIALLSFVV